MKRFVSAAAAFTLGVTSASAEDVDGRYAIKGVGQMSCATFNEALDAEREDAKAALIWLSGYLTGINASVPETFDVVSWQSEGMIAQALRNRCASSPEEPLAQAIAAMVETMKLDRISSSDEAVTIDVGERSRVLYRSVIRRMQSELSQIDEKIDESGVFDKRTENALRTFQRQSDLAATGFPDSITLFRLFNDQR